MNVIFNRSDPDHDFYGGLGPVKPQRRISFPATPV